MKAPNAKAELIAANPPTWLAGLQHKDWAETVRRHRCENYGAAVAIFRAHLRKSGLTVWTR